MSFRTPWGLLCLAALVPGCSCNAPDRYADDLGVSDQDVVLDASGPSDAAQPPDGDLGFLDAAVGGDAGDDAGALADSGTTDVAVDAGSAAVDGGQEPCGTGCIPSDPCVTTRCDTSTDLCVETPRPLGETCGELGDAICVFGECVMRGCGDGYREPGSMQWPREGCDDGDPTGDDACSATCEPIQYIADVGVDLDPEDEYDAFVAPGSQLLAVDGLGYALYIWQQDFFGTKALRGLRFDRLGAPLDAPTGFVIDAALPANAGPAVVGLSGGGFVVAYAAPRVDGRDIVLVPVSLEGAVGTERIANTQTSGGQSSPSLAALSDSFVVAWEEQRTNIPSDPDGGVRARRFRETFAPLSSEIVVQTANAGRQSAPSVAAQLDVDGRPTDDWMVVFSTQPAFAGPRYVHARRFLNSGGLGSEFAVQPGEALGADIAGLPGIAGDYVVAWVHREVDLLGDIAARTVPGHSSGVFGAIVPIATVDATAEDSPVVVPYGPIGLGGYVVAYQEGGSPTPALTSVAAMLPPEVMTLDLVNGEGPLVAAPGPATSGGSIWLTFTGFAGIPNSGLAAWLFLLPPS